MVNPKNKRTISLLIDKQKAEGIPTKLIWKDLRQFFIDLVGQSGIPDDFLKEIMDNHPYGVEILEGIK